MNCLYKYKAEQVVFALKVFVQTLTSSFVYSWGSQMHSCICWLCVRSRTSCGKIIKIKTSAFNVDFQTLKLRIHQQCKLYNVCEERWQKWILYYPNSRVWLCLIKGNGGRTGPERGDNTHLSSLLTPLNKTSEISGDPKSVCASASEGVHSNYRRDSKHPSGFPRSPSYDNLFCSFAFFS